MLCDDALRNKVHQNLRSFDIERATQDDLRRAAVAITVTNVRFGADVGGLPAYQEVQADAALMLTRRSENLRNHPGQWAFPGGRLDAGETPVEAALREMHEEVNVALDEDRVLGQLDDFVTRSGYVMTPIVVWGGPDLQTDVNPEEVASVHRIPLTEFLRADAPIFEKEADSDQPVLRMPVGDDYIAAPTAALIYQFREVCLLGKHTRVAHFEQPKFAWK